jgi:hypothetical protein
MNVESVDRGWVGHRSGLLAEELGALLAAFYAGGSATACFHLLRSPLQIGDLSPGLPSEPAAYERGRCFGPRGEVRWQREPGGTFAAWCLTEDEGAMPGGFVVTEWRVRRPVHGQDAELQLWPRNEMRIPRTLHYPGGREQIRYCEYQSDEGLTQYVRLVEVR